MNRDDLVQVVMEVIAAARELGPLTSADFARYRRLPYTDPIKEKVATLPFHKGSNFRNAAVSIIDVFGVTELVAVQESPAKVVPAEPARDPMEVVQEQPTLNEMAEAGSEVAAEAAVKAKEEAVSPEGEVVEVDDG